MREQTIKRIPYGIADYRRMRIDNAHYVDKTHFIPLIEAAPYYLFCIRPRRFGKTLWLSLLRHYYDINFKDEFATLFADTYIGAHPTAERNSYLILFFNFALVNPDVRYVQTSFKAHCRTEIESFLQRYKRFFTYEEWQAILHETQVEYLLLQLAYYTEARGLNIYCLIDEYDSFANTIFTVQGVAAYETLMHDNNFLCRFFTMLRGMTAGQARSLARLFATGVSPILRKNTIGDFTIGSDISADERFHEIVGFTLAEMRSILNYHYKRYPTSRAYDVLLTDVEKLYNHYYFCPEANSYLFSSEVFSYIESLLS